MDVDQEIFPSGNCNQVAQDFADQLPPGYRFCPTDSELIVYYLNAKIESRQLPECRLHEFNIYNHKPEELAERYRPSENKWYFLTPRDRKYAKGKRPSRTVGNFGFWKTTQKHKPVRDHATRQMVGYKGTLTFFDMNKKKTMWLMHEYTTNGPNLPFGSGKNKKLNEWVLCKIYKNEKNQSANGEEEDGNTMIQEEGETMIQEEVREEQDGTPERCLRKRLRVSENRENNFSNHVEVEEANGELGSHVKNGGTMGETRMKTSSSPIPMQPRATFQGSYLIQSAPYRYHINQFISDASNGFKFSNGASISVSMEAPVAASIQPTVHGLNSIQPVQRESYQNTLSSTACNGPQLQNDAMNSSSTEPPEAGAQQLLTTVLAPSPANYNVLQRKVHHDVRQQHEYFDQMSYQDPQSQLYMPNGSDQYTVMPHDDIPQPDGDGTWSLEDLGMGHDDIPQLPDGDDASTSPLRIDDLETVPIESLLDNFF